MSINKGKRMKLYYIIILACVTFLLPKFAFGQDPDLPSLYEFTIEELDTVKHTLDLIALGTRSKGRSMADAAVPVEVLTAEDINGTGHTELSQVLTFLLPYFNANNQTISDGTDHIAPASLHGTGPDQLLVFVNGKRRHTSALVNVNGTFGRGTVGTDFNAIPLSAIERIEILRDGASAQYGSDAIGGVINIVLKESHDVKVTSSTGTTVKGDGSRSRTGFSVGSRLGTKGSLFISGEMATREATDRSGDYTGTVYANTPEEDATDPRTQNFDRHVMSIGNAAATYTSLFFNTKISLNSQNDQVYVFGGLTYHMGVAAGFYRFPKETHKVVLELYPDGFLPELHVPISDKAVTAGMTKKYGEWNFDISNTYGGSKFDIVVENTNNRSMGVSSPLSFYAGGFTFYQNTGNFDIYRNFQNFRQLKSINVAFGAELRLDEFAIIAGEEASYFDGGELTDDGSLTLPGSQLFSGFREENELKRTRSSFSVYSDIDLDVSDKLFFNGAVRYVNYSDFGANKSIKFGGRYRFSSTLVTRFTVSTGFRAPSLHQNYSTNVGTQIIDGQSYQVGTFNHTSVVTRAFDIPSLKAETSRNVSIGFLIQPIKTISLDINIFNIDIANRIVLSGRFNNDNLAVAKILVPYGVNSAQFFTNAVNSRSSGVDLKLTGNLLDTDKLKLKLWIAGNYMRTEVVGNVKVSDVLTGSEDILFNREERSRLESAVPNSKTIFGVKTNYRISYTKLSVVRFGKVEYVHPSNPEQDQTFTAKTLTDLELGHTFYKHITLAMGGCNIFNVYPDIQTHPDNISSGRFIYSRRVKQFSNDGTFFYLKLNVNF